FDHSSTPPLRRYRQGKDRAMLRDFFRIRDRANFAAHPVPRSTAFCRDDSEDGRRPGPRDPEHARPRVGAYNAGDLHAFVNGKKQAASKMDEIFGPVAVRVAVKNATPKPS